MHTRQFCKAKTIDEENDDAASRCAALFRATKNFDSDFVCVPNFEKDECPVTKTVM